ncbi:PLDc N-terminal domain-containing protein [Leifsonia sp. LS-T14]|uniref:PLDc N-terminal domain-containing protein n=1 Tax=unclassified Leifsonia TaxID=2663824 RepID=UPI0035A5C884
MVVLTLIVFAFVVFALADIIQRPKDEVRVLPKVVWVLVVILLPLVGSILWLTLGRERAGSTRRSTLRMPVTRSAPAAPPHPPAPMDPAEGDAGSTEAQLAALDREIAAAERDLRIHQLEEELRRRKDAGGVS